MKNINPIFIIGGVRTGSTLLYQIIAKYFDVWYISNNVNINYSKEPVVGIELEIRNDVKNNITLKNNYGKTNNLFDVSEASNVLMNWFGGGHPSQIKSSRILNKEKEKHMFNVFDTVKYVFGKDIVIKNAWNNFRISEINRIFPYAKFIWLKRDINDAAISDYLARKKIGDPKTIWNSSTPANYKEIQKYSPFKQVVLQQYEYYKVLEETLKDHISIWYEDLCENFDETIIKICNYLNIKYTFPRIKLKKSSNRQNNIDIFQKVNEVVKEYNLERYEINE